MPISTNLRHIVFERDSYTCIFCERPAADCHHVILQSQGGRNIPHNLVAVCRCHHDALHSVNIPFIKETRDELRAYATAYLKAYHAIYPP